MSKEMREQIDRVKNWKQFLSENYTPDDNDLDISLKHKQGNILYDFWRSDYVKNYIGLSDWLEENDYEIYKDGKYKGFDGILYQFWSDNPDVDNENVFLENGLSSVFFDWLFSSGYEIKGR